MFSQGNRPAAVKEDIDLPMTGASLLYKDQVAFLLHNVLTEEECQSFIEETEKQGYEDANTNLGEDSQTPAQGVRTSSRCAVDNQEWADELWSRIKGFLPSVFRGRKVLGLNERLRFLRYDPGEYYKPHYDGVFIRENGERSAITFQLYLNEGFEGGETTIFGLDEEKLPIVPKTGSALIFEHDILHEGSDLIKGRKYLVRTDIMVSADTIEEAATAAQ